MDAAFDEVSGPAVLHDVRPSLRVLVRAHEVGVVRADSAKFAKLAIERECFHDGRREFGLWREVCSHLAVADELR